MVAKYSEWTRGQDEALLNKLGGMEMALKLLDCRKVTVTFDSDSRQATVKGEAPARRWREENGIIYFSVTSDGTTGPEWIERLKRKGFRVSRWAEDLLRSPDFTPTNGVKYEIAVLKGELFPDSERITRNIRSRGQERDWKQGKDISPEIACLIRELLLDEDLKAMGLWWVVVMHKPIQDSVGNPSLLGANRLGGGRWLRAYYGNPGYRWPRGSGFAFVVSQA